jgi:hypothetical protein
MNETGFSNSNAQIGGLLLNAPAIAHYDKPNFARRKI